MAKATEIEEWRNKARKYRELALKTDGTINRKMLEDLAQEADTTADEIAGNQD